MIILAKVSSHWIAAALGLVMLWIPAQGIAETLIVERLDGSPVKVLIDRPVDEDGLPIVLFIDGSGCVSAERESIRDFLRLPDHLGKKVAKVLIEKPGVSSVDDGSNCSQTFADYYSMEQRALDHLRAIQHLRRHASWWNREIYLVGWSDGATIGVPVAAYTPEIKRAVFGGMGGGISMASQFEDYVICTPDRSENPEACIEDLRETYDEIRANPSSKKAWFGDSNTYKAWASRLDVVEYHLIKDLTIPILIIHGELDRDSVPVEAARALNEMLTESGGVDFEYWEIPDMDHGIRSLGEVRGEKVRLAMFNWLFGQAPGAGGPPGFGRTAPE